MACPSHLFGRDVDDVFSYSTIKYVQIRDRRLGLTKLLLTLAVSGYVGLYSLWYEGLYLEKSPLTGACRFTLQQPTQGNCDPTDPGCLNDYGSPADAAYCAQSALPYAGNKRTCEFYEQIGAQQTMDSSLLVSTRITTLEQRLVCNATHGPATCPQVYDVASERTNYVMAAERFTVLIDHSVLATSIRHLQGTSSALSGRLYVKKSHALCEAYGGSVTMRGLARGPRLSRSGETATRRRVGRDEDGAVLHPAEHDVAGPRLLQPRRAAPRRRRLARRRQLRRQDVPRDGRVAHLRDHVRRQTGLRQGRGGVRSGADD